MHMSPDVTRTIGRIPSAESRLFLLSPNLSQRQNWIVNSLMSTYDALWPGWNDQVHWAFDGAVHSSFWVSRQLTFHLRTTFNLPVNYGTDAAKKLHAETSQGHQPMNSHKEINSATWLLPNKCQFTTFDSISGISRPFFFPSSSSF